MPQTRAVPRSAAGSRNDRFHIRCHFAVNVLGIEFFAIQAQGVAAHLLLPAGGVLQGLQVRAELLRVAHPLCVDASCRLPPGSLP